MRTLDQRMFRCPIDDGDLPFVRRAYFDEQPIPIYRNVIPELEHKHHDHDAKLYYWHTCRKDDTSPVIENPASTQLRTRKRSHPLLLGNRTTTYTPTLGYRASALFEALAV